jgi:hypothetical protein
MARLNGVTRISKQPRVLARFVPPLFIVHKNPKKNVRHSARPRRAITRPKCAAAHPKSASESRRSACAHAASPALETRAAPPGLPQFSCLTHATSVHEGAPLRCLLGVVRERGGKSDRRLLGAQESLASLLGERCEGQPANARRSGPRSPAFAPRRTWLRRAGHSDAASARPNSIGPL